MKPTLAPGIAREERITVDRDRTISFLGEDLRLYSTPSMVRDIEYTALRLIQEHLGEGESSVGVHIEVDHLAATPLGQEVAVEVTVVAIEGRKISLEAKVRDAVEDVGRGRHVRFVIDVARHAKRLREKLERLEDASF
ncbi:MAG TPA: hotdog domain-containing protein [Vicinamibacteria bacterium]|nr:hotdog domain-containing protein [Vicinamibacteria bacterium]